MWKRLIWSERSAAELLAAIILAALLLALAWPAMRERRSELLTGDLWQAANQGNRTAVLRYLRLGARPDAWSGSTPHFCLACEAIRDRDVVLLRAIFPPEAGMSRTFAAHCPPLLVMAVEKRHLAMAEILLRAGASPTRRLSCVSEFTNRPADASPLGAAIAGGDNPMVDLLLEHCTAAAFRPATKVDGPFRTDPELLHTAVSADDIGTVQALLDRGISVNGRDREGRTGLDRAHQRGGPAIATLLRRHGGVESTVLDDAGLPVSHTRPE